MGGSTLRYFRKLTGEKCYLSPVNPEDAEKYAEWLNDIDVVVNLQLAHQIISLPKERDVLERLAKEEYAFAIVDLKSDQLIGNCGLHGVDLVNRTAELGIFIGDKTYWGKGYGTEAVTLLLDYAFNMLNLESVMLRVFAYNKRAIKCYRKCGFQEIGTRRRARMIGGRLYDVLYMDVLAEEFAGSYIQKKLPKGQ